MTLPVAIFIAKAAAHLKQSSRETHTMITWPQRVAEFVHRQAI